LQQLRIRLGCAELTSVPIKEEDLTRMAPIGGMKDRLLAENYNLKTTIDTMKTRESSKANAVAMRGLAEGTEDVKRVKGRTVNEYDTDEIEKMEADLKVMKLRRQGRYSCRRQGAENRKKCRNCNLSTLMVMNVQPRVEPAIIVMVSQAQAAQEGSGW
jgi:NADH pyrophosphatase NudC (nudix superfamily)